ncbi:MAG: SsrA-binding protein SmpB [Bacteroidota bacterium]
MLKGRNTVIVQNRKARFEYSLEEVLTAGMALKGTEVKSLRLGKASIQEAYCIIEKDEVFIRGLTIPEYPQGNIFNHEPTRTRKLLLTKKEIRKLRKGIEQKGNTIVPLKIFFDDRNLAKINIALAKGKKIHDKRESVKKRDTQRELDRNYK